MDFSHAGIQSQGALETIHRYIGLVIRQKGTAHIVIGFRVAGLNREGFVEIGDRVRNVALVQIGVT